MSRIIRHTQNNRIGRIRLRGQDRNIALILSPEAILFILLNFSVSSVLSVVIFFLYNQVVLQHVSYH